MTNEEKLLVKLAEECTELAKDCLKAALHGIDNYHPAYPEGTNRTRIDNELHDVLAIAQMLNFWGNNWSKLDAKILKMKKFLAEGNSAYYEKVR